MPNKSKIHFDANSVPSCDRFDSDPTDISVCCMATENSPLTACETEVTCSSCRRTRYFRENFPHLALPPRKAQSDRKVRSIRVTAEEMVKMKEMIKESRGRVVPDLSN